MPNIKIDINPPNHIDNIKQCKDYIKQIKIDIYQCTINKHCTTNTYKKIEDKLTNILYYVGDLSKWAFEAQDNIKNQYYSNFPKSPELAKQNYLQHYENIHKPYNNLKNSIFRLFDQIDQIYKKYN